MGFDAFGLPAEQAAISRNVHPWKWTYANIERMRSQMKSMGNMFDWEREMISCQPEYYKWTEWFFKQFYENDLAYRGEALVNWSDALQTVLANEQVIDGKDERLGQPVIQKLMTQWFFRYTRYAEEMLKFDTIDWPEPIVNSQTNWIGKSVGAKVTFKTEAGDDLIVFTTRPDTLWGATFMVLSPEHPLVDKIATADKRQEIFEYQEIAARSTEIERMSTDREKTGVFTGGYAINPVNNARIPVWIADYVMINYGTGAIMAVPSGDQRDFEFARKFGLEIIPVVQSESEPFDGATMTEAYDGAGVMVNSDWLNGAISNGEKGEKNPAIAKVIAWLEKEGIGKANINYRLRDWLISRQRYWGSPIPIVYDPQGNMHVLPDDELPVVLPENVDFSPTGRSPLTYFEPFLNYKEGWRRETDTMDTFMCSSWYWYRYLSPHETNAPFSDEDAAYWLPVDTYSGGSEHGTMHLLYARWFAKAMRDLGMFDGAKKIAEAHGRDTSNMFDEPFLQLRNQGQVLGGKRIGDYVVARGTQEGGKFVATSIEVIAPMDAPEDSADVIHGELIKRVERNLFIGDNMTLVEALPDASVAIPSIDGQNNLNQLKQHLDIQRMSKSKGNVVNPDELVTKYGADAVRAHMMFAFDWQIGGPWDEANVLGVTRWLDDVWAIVNAHKTVPATGNAEAEREIVRIAHVMIQRITDSFEKFSFNTAVSALMTFRKALKPELADNTIGKATFEEVINIMLRCMAPITPHIAEELWEAMGWGYSVHQQPFPEFDAEKAKANTVELVIMINGKPRDKVTVSAEIEQAEAEKIALANEAVQRAFEGRTPQRVVFIAARGNQEPKVNVVG